MKASFTVFVAIFLMTLSGSTIPVAGEQSNTFHLHVYALEGWSSTPGNYTRPGPTLTGFNNSVWEIVLYADDEDFHVFWIDIDGSDNMTTADISIFFIGTSTVGVYISFRLPAGNFKYYDYYDTDLDGTIVSETASVPPPPPPPKSWWRWDPFFIFGIFVELALAGFGLFLFYNGCKWYMIRRQVKNASPEIKKWVKAIMDPDCPTRPTESYVYNLRIEKKKRRKRGDNSDKRPRTPTDDKSGGKLGLG